MPEASMSTTVPNGSISIDLFTGSVVVPLTSETTAVYRFATAFIRPDFPAFRLPKKTMCVLPADGVSFNVIVFPP